MRNLPPHFKAVNLSYSPVHYSLPTLIEARQGVQLACVKHLDSIQSEPSSNSFLYLFLLRLLFKEIYISLDAKVFPS